MLILPSRHIELAEPAAAREFRRRARRLRAQNERAHQVMPLGSATMQVSAVGVASGAAAPWVAQWKFNNNGNDSIGANNLTNNNSATFTTGKLGGATGATHLVSASQQYWNISSNSTLVMGGVDFTILGWIYLNSKANGQGLICKEDLLGTSLEYDVRYAAAVDRFRFILSTDGSTPTNLSANSFGSPSLSTWYLVAAWYDSNLKTLYIQIDNGAIDSTTISAQPYTSTQPVRLGFFGGNNWADSNLDDICIAKSATGGGGVLTQAQRDAFWNSGNGTEALT